MYLSGAPLHVITLALTHVFRQRMGPEIPISYSAGVDRKNFPNMVACGFLPVTTCTDLLKTGGYGRLAPYLQDLEGDMRVHGVRTVSDYILEARDQRAAAGGETIRAGWLNTSIIAAETAADPRYTAAKNSMIPRRINSHLVLFDCITCDKCVPVCPNDANFIYETPPVDLHYRDIEVAPDGTITEVGDQQHFVIGRTEQIANYADFCNHCGNCDTFCPEWDGPYLKKPNFFGSRESFDAAAAHDGFLLAGEPDSFTLHARITGQSCRLQQKGDGSLFSELKYDDGAVALEIADGQAVRLATTSARPAAPHRVDMGRFHTLVALLKGITSPARVHQINTRLLAASTI
jgi:putative selenate reductase